MKYEKNFSKAKKQIDENIRSALKEIGVYGAAEAQVRAPVDTGELRRSIGSSVSKNSVHIGATADHSAYVELGTSKQKAQPYIKPAIYENTENIKHIVSRKFKGGLK